MVMKAIVTGSDFSNPGKLVTVNLLNSGVGKIPLMQQNGFASNPVPNTDCVILSVNGNIEHQIIIATEKYGEVPVTLEPGDSVLYSIGTQSYVHCKADGSMDIVGTDLIVNADTVTVTADTVTVNATTVDVTATTVNVTATDVAIAGSVAVTGALTLNGSPVLT